MDTAAERKHKLPDGGDFHNRFIQYYDNRRIILQICGGRDLASALPETTALPPS
jgi:hypothetical protein